MSISNFYQHYFHPCELNRGEKAVVIATYLTVAIPIIMATVHAAAKTIRWIASKVNRGEENDTVAKTRQVALQSLRPTDRPTKVNQEEVPSGGVSISSASLDALLFSERRELRGVIWMTAKHEPLDSLKGRVANGESDAIHTAIPWLMQCLICRGVGHGVKEIDGECIDYMGTHKQALVDAVLDIDYLRKYAEILYEDNPQKEAILEFFERSFDSDVFKVELQEARKICADAEATSQQQEHALCRVLSLFDQVQYYQETGRVYQTPKQGPSERVWDLQRSFEKNFEDQQWFEESETGVDMCSAMGNPSVTQLRLEINQEDEDKLRRAQWIDVNTNIVLKAVKNRVKRGEEAAIQKALPWLIESMICRRVGRAFLGDGERVTYMGRRGKSLCFNAILDPKYLRQYAERRYAHNENKERILKFFDDSFKSAIFQRELILAREVCNDSRISDQEKERKLCTVLMVFNQVRKYRHDKIYAFPHESGMECAIQREVKTLDDYGHDKCSHI